MKNKTKKIGRDASSGQFITIKEAKKHPKTTVVETITVKKHPTKPKDAKSKR